MARGQHEPLVTEELFLRVNQVISKYPTNFVQRKTDDLLPLKRFIKCEKCGTTWVGYLVTKKKAYYYKCNKKGCLCNRNAAKMHDQFKDFLSTYSIPERFFEPLKAQLAMTFKEMTKDKEVEKIRLQSRLKECKEAMYKVEERFALGVIDDGDLYKRIKNKFLIEIEGIETELQKVDLKLSNQDNFIHYSIKLSSKLNTMWSSGSFELKQRLQTLVFPEGVTYDFENNTYRTCRVNAVFATINWYSTDLLQKNSGFHDLNLEKSASVARSRLELPTFGL
jgi:site-specific DNA recombinase